MNETFKSSSKTKVKAGRRSSGATLGLAAACVWVVIMIGVGLYFVSKIIGGGREVANATDGGAINVAKLALKRGTVDLRTISVPIGGGYSAYADSEFGELTDPPNSHIITLVTYNRVIAQAMMVAKNADMWNNPIGNDPTAAAHAQYVAALAEAVGQALQKSLQQATTQTLPGDFNAISTASNTKMWNGNPVTCTGITEGYLKAKGSTNIIWDASTAGCFNNWSPADTGTGPNANNLPNKTDSLGIVIGGNAHYVPGYDVNTFQYAGVTLTGVPVFPNTKPHLVDIGAFNADLTANAAFPLAPLYAPANCFSTSSQALEAKSNNVGGSIACAVVGVLNKDFIASIPRGIIRISNGPDALNTNGSFGTPVSDGTNDIFNNQLFTGPGAAPGASGITQDGTSNVFTTTPTYLSAWSNFNARTGAYNNSTQYPAVVAAAGVTGPCWVAFNVNPAGTAYPPGTFVPQADLPTTPDPLQQMAANPSNYDANEGGLRAGNDCQTPYATLPELEEIGTTNFSCNYTMYDDSLTGPCALVSNVDTWQSNYQCTTTFPASVAIANGGSNMGVTNVEYLKGELLAKIDGRLGGHYCADVTIPTGQPSGVKYFSRGVPGTSGSAVAFDPLLGGASPVVNFETVASPYDYLTQISDGTPGGGPGPCGVGPGLAVINQICERLQQISPEISLSQVETALQSKPLHMKNSGTADNGHLYLYVDPGDHHTVKMDILANLPEGFSDPTLNSTSYPDGLQPNNLGQGYCVETYPLNGWVVDTQFTLSGTGKGDAHYHDQPFTQPPTNGSSVSYTTDWWWGTLSSGNEGGASIQGQDMAMFTPSSGAANLLGELVFEENVQGTTFCKPN